MFAKLQLNISEKKYVELECMLVILASSSGILAVAFVTHLTSAHTAWRVVWELKKVVQFNKKKYYESNFFPLE